MQKALDVASDAVKRAGKMVMKGLGAKKYAETKSHIYDPVTVFDRRSEKILADEIGRAHV